MGCFASTPVQTRAPSSSGILNPLVGKYEAVVTEVYDGDTFTCYFDWNRQRCLVKVRVIGFNSEEISCSRYSTLKDY